MPTLVWQNGIKQPWPEVRIFKVVLQCCLSLARHSSGLLVVFEQSKFNCASITISVRPSTVHVAWYNSSMGKYRGCAVYPTHAHSFVCLLGCAHMRLMTRLPLSLKYTGEGGAWGRGYNIAFEVWLAKWPVQLFCTGTCIFLKIDWPFLLPCVQYVQRTKRLVLTCVTKKHPFTHLLVKYPCKKVHTVHLRRQRCLLDLSSHTQSAFPNILYSHDSPRVCGSSFKKLQ